MRSMNAFRSAGKTALFCWLLGAFARASAAQYEVEGQIAQTIYKADGSVQSEQTNRFAVYVNDCSWLIQATNLDEDGTPLNVSETASTNGGVIYSVIVPANPDAPRRGGPGSAPYWNTANIYSNAVPVGETDGDDIGHLWLMFASGCHLKNLSTNRLTPVYDLNASASVDATLKRPAKWDWTSGQGSLPLNVTYYQNGPDSPIAATYSSTGVTNAGDLAIASGFVFEQRTGARFAPGQTKPGDAAPSYRIRKRAVATVTAVRPYCSRKEFVPKTKGDTRVTDERLARVPNANRRMLYRFPDGVRWISVESAIRMVATQTPPRHPPSKPIVVGILLAPAAVVLSLWFLNRSKGQAVGGVDPIPGDPPDNPPDNS
jgi:hypothetical protein